MIPLMDGKKDRKVYNPESKKAHYVVYFFYDLVAWSGLYQAWHEFFFT